MGDPLSPFFALLEALNCGAALLDRTGRIVASNPRLGQMMGREATEFVGAEAMSLYDDGEAKQLVRELLEHFDRPAEREFYLPLANGQRLPVMLSSRPLGGRAPLCDHQLVTMVDISGQKKAEERLKEQYKIIAELSNTILDQAMDLKQYNTRLEQRVRERTAELHEANLDAIYMLAVASEAKDQDTGRHVRRIQQSAVALAKELGLDEAEAEAIGYSAVLHDVGKMHVPDQILKKPGALTQEERKAVQQHTIIGERILADRPFFSRARRIARSHHENWDGSGYPDRLSGDEIPLEARIVHLADVYDALTSARVYKVAWPTYQAAEVIEESAARMFDPEIVKAFQSLHHRGVLPLSETG